MGANKGGEAGPAAGPEAGPAGDPAAPQGNADDGVIDADYTMVDEDNKKKKK